MGKDGFSWFVGVVEDRNDPAKLGRVRVRVLGRHSEYLTDVQTTDLPWAHVMHPVTDPSMQGLGHTPSFLTQGSWVVGFFRDTEAQQPVIMGSLPGIPENRSDNTQGFNDPRGDNSLQENYEPNPTYGPYPSEYMDTSGHGLNEPDTNRLARGIASESHQSLIERRLSKLTDIPIATKPDLTTTSFQSTQDVRGTWSEPDPKGIVENANPYISAAYPYNHVFESESGHITEMDDSPGAERMFRQHKAGTFEEIHPDGSVVTKIVGNNYEIVIGSEAIVIKGPRYITVEGSVRELIKGDYIQEIEGDFYQKIHKNHRVKVGASGTGNLEEEILGNHGYNINEDVKGRIGGDVIINSEKSKFDIINGQYMLFVDGETNPTSNSSGSGIMISSGSDYVLDVATNISQSTISGIVSVMSGATLNIKSVGIGTITFSGIGSEVNAKNGAGTNIPLTAHIHSQGNDSDGDTEVDTTAPVS